MVNVTLSIHSTIMVSIYTDNPEVLYHRSHMQNGWYVKEAMEECYKAKIWQKWPSPP